MTKLSVCLFALVAMSMANPIMIVALSEVQTAPDSLERIEFHMYSGLGGGYDDLSGAEVITNGGTAVIDSGMVLTADNYLVIDRSNTSGAFSLGDDSDYIRIHFPGEPDTMFRLRYPANPFLSVEESWAPLPGQSCALFQWFEFVPPGEWFDCYTWYIDETPTFGERNDDTLGGISGYVRDDRGLPVDGATVRITSSQGAAAMLSGYRWNWPDGYFVQSPTGPGTFTVTAECPGYLPGAYPEPIALGPNEGRQITIVLDRVGVAEQKPAGPAQVSLRVVGRTLMLQSDQAGTAGLIIRDNLGRARHRVTVNLNSGSNEVPLRLLSSGIYFVSCRFRERTSNTKLVLF